MPSLYYGNLGNGKRLHDQTGKEIESSVFDRFKIKHLAPDEVDWQYVAYVWHIKAMNHTAVSWYDEQGKKHAVFMAGFHSPRSVIPTLREEFGDLIPSSIVFRLADYDTARYL